ncbi:hypothetical protein GQ600_13613 [Phytophthora cactorum]|nr:hypothetical protein GQ600_13613 [Phytophthora cactorum]
MVDKYKPTGRTTWEVAAAEYSSKRARSRAQRDFDSLHRKFRNLYGMPKHTGNQGDKLTPRQRPIMLAHEIQYEIESKGGVHTTHDGRDEGSKTKQSGARLTRIARKTRRLTKMIRGARWKARSRPRTPGRPRRPMRELLQPTVNILSETRSAAAATAELNRNRNLTTTSSRLVGRGHRVLRDNFEEMGGRPNNNKSKRSASESSAPTTYTTPKRARAKKRMENLEKKQQSAETAADNATAHTMQMMIFFRGEADRGADSEE